LLTPHGYKTFGELSECGMIGLDRSESPGFCRFE